MLQHIIFDWDGTLADTYPILNKAYAYAFKKLNLAPISNEEIKKITSTAQNRNVISIIYGKNAEPARELFYEYIQKNHTKELKEMSGAKEVLDFCFKNNLNLLLLTNKTRTYLLEELKHLGFLKYFSKIVAAGDFEKDKPDPIACQALFGNNIPSADKMLVIGDGLSDLKVAEFFGAEVIVYNPKNIQTVKGNYNIDDLKKTIDIIKGKIS